MKLLMFSPYGEQNPGSGTMYMLLRYMQSYCIEISQLHCNGAFSVCERDTMSPQGRSIEHCLKCSGEQRTEAQFAGADILKITDFLNPEDLQKTWRWVLERDAETLWDENWYGFDLQSLMGQTFHRLEGEAVPKFKSKRHAFLIRRLSLVAVRMAVAIGRCINRERPDWIWVPAGEELLTKTARIAAEDSTASVARFQPAPDGQMIMLYRDNDSQPYRLQNVISSIRDVRTDIGTWPKEVINEFDDFLGYLGISITQLGLPVAR